MPRSFFLWRMLFDEMNHAHAANRHENAQMHHDKSLKGAKDCPNRRCDQPDDQKVNALESAPKSHAENGYGK
jgi:hypothetical protein